MSSACISTVAAIMAVVWAGGAAAQQPASAQSPDAAKTGACVVTAANRTTTCTSKIEEAACRAQAQEMHGTPVWNASQGCP